MLLGIIIYFTYSWNKAIIAKKQFDAELKEQLDFEEKKMKYVILMLIGADDFGPEEQRQFDEVIQAGSKYFSIYESILNDPITIDFEIRRLFYFLSLIKDDASCFMDKALQYLSDGKRDVKHSIIQFIGNHGSKRDLSVLVSLLYDKELPVVGAAAQALSKIGDERAAIALKIWLDSDSHRDIPQQKDFVANCRAELILRLEKEKKSEK